MTNMPNDETTQLPLADRLDEIGAQHGIPRNHLEHDEAYAERIIDAIDTKIERLWEAQDSICTLLIAHGVE